MPAAGVPNPTPNAALLTPSELGGLARYLVQERGVRKLRLTGGEPLLRHDLLEVLRALRSVTGREQRAASGLQAFGLTTNAVNLERYLPALVASGLDAVNISLDTLQADRFTALTRRDGQAHLPRVLRAVDAAVDAGLRVRVNCVVMRGRNDDELETFCEYFAQAPARGLSEMVDAVRFIEYMPFEGNEWHQGKMVSYAEMRQRLQPRLLRDTAEPDRHDTTKYWRYRTRDGTDVPLRVGFITSMSEHFCAGCNRIRITANGHLRPCLFGRHEVDLRPFVQRGDWEACGAAIDAALLRKAFALGGASSALNDLPQRMAHDRPMTAIGG